MSSVRCVRCNLVNFATATHCRRCGSEVTVMAQPQPEPPAPSAPYPQSAESMPFMPYGSLPAAPPPPAWQAVPPYQQPPYYPAYQAAYYGPPPQLKQGLAITSLAVGCVGLLLCVVGILTAIPGIICGIIAVKKAGQNPAEYGGKGIAIAGIVLNGVVLLMFPVVLAIAIPNLLASRQVANETLAIRHVSTLAAAEATYQATTGRGKDFGTWEQLVSSGLLDKDSKSRYAYNFKIIVVNCPEIGRYSSCRPHFEIHATPAGNGVFGTDARSFYIDENFILYGGKHSGKEASNRDLPVTVLPESEF